IQRRRDVHGALDVGEQHADVLALPGEGRSGRADLAREVLRRLGLTGAPRRALCEAPSARAAVLLASGVLGTAGRAAGRPRQRRAFSTVRSSSAKSRGLPIVVPRIECCPKYRRRSSTWAVAPPVAPKLTSRPPGRSATRASSHVLPAESMTRSTPSPPVSIR